ncbi:DNA-binding protein [Aeromonas dhakensis]|uniref:DNA-binding protein n=1 Tax=Aeromonas dhakensis TaxID=196024 RepID=UPI000378F8C4|nr:DNA-binding protein [Aeromonas dhakensis]HDT5887592.1 DNA-binding protein [Aeromonas dhakensis]HDZ8926111.1 DNA-binding protein [Aeromonas dhakensis]HEB4976777.1 DNA-binding protein [Aeromonas dhakensis]
MSAQEIIRIANELAAKGIAPTTAMVKARLGQPVPMAELLKVLSQWKQQPAAAPEVASPAQEASAPAAEPTLQQLAERLERLERKVDRLTELLLQQGKL